MATDPMTVDPDLPVRAAIELVIDEGVSHLLVTEREDLVGLVCLCDLDAAPTGASVRECMSRELVTIDVATSPAEAVHVMLEGRIGCLPVVSEGELCGVVTLGDLRRAGFVDLPVERCVACGSTEHVRCDRQGRSVGLCLECTRRSEPPGSDDDLGGG
jgi:CBS-domain-containing membrane protein